MRKLGWGLSWGSLSSLELGGPSVALPAWVRGDAWALDTACRAAPFSGVRAMYGVDGPTRRLLVAMGIPGLRDSSVCDDKGI